ncbi:hypothetical protein HPCPY1124_1515 [Helicobacter pylori CPY1124]|nr:hypothetical protein [Helicobacter pylori]EJB12850.1 hypothetical protein HPCPY1124_1515 [Helicobacter pylori CPY1124]
MMRAVVVMVVFAAMVVVVVCVMVMVVVSAVLFFMVCHDDSFDQKLNSSSLARISFYNIKSNQLLMEGILTLIF